MLNLNDDMDDLIRQAADDYPLKIEGKNWDKVFGAMSSAPQVQPVNGKKYWWMLLLLLPLLIAIPFMNKNNNTQKPSTYSDAKKTEVTTNGQNAGGSLNKNDKSINKENKQTDQIASNNIAAQDMKGTTDEKKQNGSQQNKQVNTNSSVSINNSSDVSAGGINSNKKGNIEEIGNANNSINTVPDRSVVADNSFDSIQNNKSQAANRKRNSSTNFQTGLDIGH